MKREKTRSSKPSEPKLEKRTAKAISRLLGMKDIVPPENKYFEFIHNTMAEVANLYSFSRLETPVMENFDLYKKLYRDGSTKHIYSVVGEKNEKIALRPDLTLGAIRAFIEHNLIELPQPTRIYSLGPIFHNDRLKNGYYRQSNQFNLQILGENSPMSEALLIYIAGSLLQQFGIDYQVQINSLGTVEVRREYASKLAAFYRERGRKTKLCNECKKNLQKNVLCLLDCKEDECVKIREEAPQIANFLSEDSKNYFAKVLEYLDEFNINYNFNPYLMRSFGYYDETIFEFWPTAENGALGKFSLAGGGRYNNLVEQLGGRSMSAVGLSMGLERIVNKMKDRALENKKAEKNLVFIAQLSDQAKIKALRLFEDLRQYGFNVKQSLVVNSLKIQLEEANVLQSKIALIMGKKEVVDETVLFRDMESGVQEVVSFKKIKEKLEKRFRDSVV